MPLRFLLDENLRGPMWDALQHHNATGAYTVDVLRVGDSLAPPLRTPDKDLLIWTEHADRVLVTLDKNTMPGHLSAHLRAGRHSPGVFLVRLNCTLARAASFVVAAAYASDPAEWRDRAAHIP